MEVGLEPRQRHGGAATPSALWAQGEKLSTCRSLQTHKQKDVQALRDCLMLPLQRPLAAAAAACLRLLLASCQTSQARPVLSAELAILSHLCGRCAVPA